MADNTQAVSALFNLLISKDYNVVTTDINGKQVSDLEDTEILTFDFVAEGKNYGKVSIIIDIEDKMYIFYGSNITKSMKATSQSAWFDLLEQLKNFAIRHANGSKIEDISRLKYFGKKRDVQEGYTGTSRTSYTRGGKGDAKIIIKHSKKLGEDDKRFRNINSIFVENCQGERFKLPFISLPGARAMARHVTNTGTPYDSFGQHICDMVNNIGVLSGFVRRSSMFEDGETAGYVTSGRNHYAKMREGLKRIAGKRGYHIYKESWEPENSDDMELDEERVRTLFTREAINAKVDNAIPLITKLEARDRMKETDEFEAWADDITSGVLNETDETIVDVLTEFFSEAQPYGLDALNVTPVLFDIINKEDFQSMLQYMAEKDPDRDSRNDVMLWLQYWVEENPNDELTLSIKDAPFMQEK